MPARKSPLERLRRAARGARPLALGVALAACDTVRAHEVTIVDGATTTRFAAQSAIGEYVELPGLRNELRLTLANYPLACERWTPPKAGEVALSLTIVLPPDVKPAPGSYAWSGLPSKDVPPHEAYVLPKALFGDHSRVFEPGGGLKLSSVSVDLHGVVSGALAFEYPGEGARPATRIDGGFEVKICRSAPAAR
jgi:hypothetical protein